MPRVPEVEILLEEEEVEVAFQFFERLHVEKEAEKRVLHIRRSLL